MCYQNANLRSLMITIHKKACILPRTSGYITDFRIQSGYTCTTRILRPPTEYEQDTPRRMYSNLPIMQLAQTRKALVETRSSPRQASAPLLHTTHAPAGTAHMPCSPRARRAAISSSLESGSATGARCSAGGGFSTFPALAACFFEAAVCS